MRFDGITPLFDEVTHKLRQTMDGNGHLYASAMFGAIWQSRGQNGHCDKPLAEIAREIGIAKKTAMKYMDILLDSGLVVEISPSARGKSAVYAIGKSSQIRFTISAEMTNGDRSGNIHFSKNGRSGTCPQLEVEHVHFSAPHDIYNHDDDNIDNLLFSLWDSLGLDEPGLHAMRRKHYDSDHELLDILYEWAEFWGNASESQKEKLGPGARYRAIQYGNSPPERKTTLADEIRANMEYQSISERLQEVESDVANGREPRPAAWVDELREPA